MKRYTKNYQNNELISRKIIFARKTVTDFPKQDWFVHIY